MRVSITPMTRSRSHQAPAGPRMFFTSQRRFFAGRNRTPAAKRSDANSDHPGPSPDGGFKSVWRRVPSFPVGAPAHNTLFSRTSSVTPAPASWSNAAVSSADWPAPITATSEPAKTDRSRCWLVWETRAVGSGSPWASAATTGGRYENWTCPAAITTLVVRIDSPEPRVTSNPPLARTTLVTRSRSTGTRRSWNHIP
jgi:hypothetical protein